MVVALEIICDAVDRYKDLCEGTHCGEHWVCGSTRWSITGGVQLNLAIMLAKQCPPDS